MTSENHLLTGEEVALWEFREKHESPLEARELERFLTNLFQEANTDEEYEEIIRDKLLEGIREIQNLDREISEAVKRERQLLSLDPTVQEIFQHIDSQVAPPNARWVSKLGPDDIPDLSCYGTRVEYWVLSRQAVSAEQVKIIQSVKEQKDTIQSLEEKRNIYLQILKCLRIEAIERKLDLPQEVEGFQRQRTNEEKQQLNLNKPESPIRGRTAVEGSSRSTQTSRITTKIPGDKKDQPLGQTTTKHNPSSATRREEEPRIQVSVGLTWDRLCITAIDEETVCVREANRKGNFDLDLKGRVYTCHELGMVSKKSKNCTKPLWAWWLLVQFARLKGSAHWSSLADERTTQNTVQARVSALRKALRNLTGIKDDPIEWEDGKYRTAFKTSTELHFKEAPTSDALQEVYDSSIRMG